MIKLAIAGTGRIAHTHARAAFSLGKCQLVGVVNHRAESMAQFAKKYGIERQYLSLYAMIDDGGVDALLICTPNALHAEQTIAALRAGIHVLVEKPMAMSAREATKVLAVNREDSALLQVAHCLRFLPDAIDLRNNIASGVIGKVIRTRSLAAHANWGPSGWFTDPLLAGGGALIDMGIHAIDTVRFTLGDPQPISVFARIGTDFGDYPVDDNGILVINWSNGVTSTVEFGWWHPSDAGVVANTEYVASEGYARLLPTAICRLDPATRQSEHVATVNSDIDDLDRLFERMYRDQLAAFLGSIEDDSVPAPGACEGLVNMQIVDAAYRSSRSGEVTHIWEEL